MFLKRYKFSLILLVFTFFLRLVASRNQDFFRYVYTDGVNRWMIQFLSRLNSFFPFSVFEFMVYVSVLCLLFYVCKWVRVFVAGWCLNVLGHVFLRIGMIAMIFYSFFTLMWGLNYYRPSVLRDFGLEMVKEEKRDLKGLYLFLIDRTNDSREFLDGDEVFVSGKSRGEIFCEAQFGYDAVATEYGVFGGRYGGVKPFLGSRLLNFPRITGVYAPFTGEANVNVSVPDVALFFTVMHEMAHQRGVALEDEANFVAFLTCVSHPDGEFVYSGYFNALRYVREALRDAGGGAWVADHDGRLSVGVANDFNDLSVFWAEYDSPFDGLLDWMSEGDLSFSGSGDDKSHGYVEVVDFLLAYFDGDY